MKRSLIWREGTLWTEGPGEEPRAWTRPADLAQARLGTDPAPESLAVADGRDMLTFAFTVAPFARGPLPEPAFGEAVTPAARAAFRVFLGLDGAGDAFADHQIEIGFQYARVDADGAAVESAVPVIEDHEIGRRLGVDRNRRARRGGRGAAEKEKGQKQKKGSFHSAVYAKNTGNSLFIR